MGPCLLKSWNCVKLSLCRGGHIVEAGTNLIFLGSKITVDSDCSHEIKRRLPCGRKAVTNLLLLLLLSRLSHVRLCATPWTAAHQAPHPWDLPGKNTGVGCHARLQGIFPTQGSNLCLMSPALADRFFTTSATWEALLCACCCCCC